MSFLQETGYTIAMMLAFIGLLSCIGFMVLMLLDMMSIEFSLASIGNKIRAIGSRTRVKKELDDSVCMPDQQTIKKDAYGMHVPDLTGRLHYITYDEIYGSTDHSYKSRELDTEEKGSDRYLPNSEYQKRQKK